LLNTTTIFGRSEKGQKDFPHIFLSSSQIVDGRTNHVLRVQPNRSESFNRLYRGTVSQSLLLLLTDSSIQSTMGQRFAFIGGKEDQGH
jgi:hypothetical protein